MASRTTVSYNGQRLIPAPFVRISKAYQTTADGTQIGAIYNISLIGPLVAYRGSPNSSKQLDTLGNDPTDESIVGENRLGAILRKQEALRSLFSVDGKSLEIQSIGDPIGASPPIKCNPRIKSIDFPEQLWYEKMDYTIELEADVIYFGDDTYEDSSKFPLALEEASDTWSMEPSDLTGEYVITHSVSAKGKRFYKDNDSLSAEAWQHASGWVIPRLGSFNLFSPTPIPFPGEGPVKTTAVGISQIIAHDHTRSVNLDKTGGTYSVTETWIAASGSSGPNNENAKELFEVTTSENTQEGRTTVNINGTISGREVKTGLTGTSGFNVEVTKWDSAKWKFSQVEPSLLTRAQTISGKTLNSLPTIKTVGRDPVNGIITYNYEYDDRPSNCIGQYMSGVLSELFTITDEHPGDVIAIIPVLGRNAGPVLQNIRTKTERRRSLSIDILVSGVRDCGSSILDSINKGMLSSPAKYRDSSNNLVIDTIVSGVAPGGLDSLRSAANKDNPYNDGDEDKVYKLSDQESWDWRSGRYNRNVVWVWEKL